MSGITLDTIRGIAAALPEIAQVPALEAAIRLDPAGNAFYNRLGENQQNMLSEMIIKDADFAKAIQDAMAAPGAAESGNMMNNLPPGLMNTLIEEAYNDPEFRKTLIQNLSDPNKVMAAITAEQAKDPAFAQRVADAYAAAPADPAPAPAEVTPAAPVDPNNPLAKLGGIFQSFMGGNWLQGINQIFEMVLGKSLTDLFKSMEVLTQSGGPNNLGDMLKTLLNPTAQVHQVDPLTGQPRTVRTSELGNEPPVQLADVDPSKIRAPSMGIQV